MLYFDSGLCWLLRMRLDRRGNRSVKRFFHLIYLLLLTTSQIYILKTHPLSFLLSTHPSSPLLRQVDLRQTPEDAWAKQCKDA